MKKVILSVALAMAAPFAFAQVSQTTTTTTTTEGTGTITEYTPGSSIVLKETAGPRHYHFCLKTALIPQKSSRRRDAFANARDGRAPRPSEAIRAF